jgi:outer membrane PBP1 activator LpoA protein
MRRLIGLFLIAMLALGCSSTPESRTAEEWQQEAREKRDAIVREMQKKLDDLDKQLLDWKLDVDKATGDAQVKLNKLYADLQVRRDNLAREIDRFNKASASAWEKLREGLDRAGYEVSDAFRKAAEEFK